IMAAVMAAGMVPPLAMALSTVARRRLYSPVERENGTTAWLLGAAFISEGAIPFAAADPLRVIPSMMAGGAVTGALVMALSVGSQARHGGSFVAFAISPVWGFVLAVLAGTLVAGALVTVLKEAGQRRAGIAACAGPAVAPASRGAPSRWGASRMLGTVSDEHAILLAEGTLGHMTAYGAAHGSMLVLLVVAAVVLVRWARRGARSEEHTSELQSRFE